MVTITLSDALEKAIKAKAMAELERAAFDLKAKSQQLCPVDKGTLRGSAFIDKKDNTITVGYGGSAAPYAVRQHEDMHLHHTVGQAKFLEKPFLEMKKTLDKRLAEAVL